MPTSGVTAWSLTARDIVRAAMQELGVLPSGGEPRSSEIADCLTRLNAMLKSWQLRGVTLGREATGTVTVTGGAQSGALAADVRAISSARLVLSATNQRPLAEVSRADYLTLPNKAAVGSPTMFYLSRQNAAPVLYLWPVSATSVSVAIAFDRVTETVTDGAQTVDVRQELQETIYACLAVRIAGMFGAQLTPELATRAVTLEREMLDAERPDSYFMYSDA